jgi:hypothetical protein
MHKALDRLSSTMEVEHERDKTTKDVTFIKVIKLQFPAISREYIPPLLQNGNVDFVMKYFYGATLINPK